jgi:hypothetical protein
MPPISRRRLLAGTGFAVAGALAAAGIGSAVAAITGLPKRDDPGRSAGGSTKSGPNGPAPAAELASALARERALLTQLAGLIAATLPTDPGQSVLTVIRADHQAHADTISALITESGAHPAPASTSTGSPSGSAGSPAATLASHKVAEQAASDAAAADAVRAHGAAAVLLASIAACEAGHVELIA